MIKTGHRPVFLLESRVQRAMLRATGAIAFGSPLARGVARSAGVSFFQRAESNVFIPSPRRRSGAIAPQGQPKDHPVLADTPPRNHPQNLTILRGPMEGNLVRNAPPLLSTLCSLFFWRGAPEKFTLSRRFLSTTHHRELYPVLSVIDRCQFPIS